LEFANGGGSTRRDRIPVPKNLVGVKRRNEALRRLGVGEEQLRSVPQITPLLKEADGGLAQVLDAMRFAPDENITMFLKKYDAVPVGDRNSLPVEAIAIAAGVDVGNLLGSAMLALQAMAVNVVKCIILSGHPKIAAARIKYGQMASGERDRNAVDIALGLLPSPKPPTFVQKAFIFGSGRAVMSEQGTGDDDDEQDGVNETDPDLDVLFPPANQTQERLQAIRQKMLPSNS
jgi:hypothetical protein